MELPKWCPSAHLAVESVRFTGVIRGNEGSLAARGAVHRLEGSVCSRYLDALEGADVAHTAATQLGDLRSTAHAHGQAAHYRNGATAQTVVGNSESQEQQGQEHDRADDHQDLDALQRRLQHGAGGNRVQTVGFTDTKVRSLSNKNRIRGWFLGGLWGVLVGI